MTPPERHALSCSDAAACPLIAVSPSELDVALASLPSVSASFVRQCGFVAEANSHCLVPDAEGRLIAVLAGLGERPDPYALSSLPTALPVGRYHLQDEPGGRLDAETAAVSWALGAYQFDRYKRPKRPPAVLVVDKAVHARSAALLTAIFQVRDLVNTPTEDLGPAQLADATAELAQQYGASVRVIEGDALLTEGFPAIHAVGRASHRAPRVIELNWGRDEHPRLALVGKGVCFDTGGLNLKGGDGMAKMKKDMGGAAHALALAGLVMAGNLPVRLRLLIAAVENALGPDAYRPGEVIATRKGLSVEIGNTDAEGRLILADALTYAGEWQPDLICDFATLTGAARIALGPDLPALYGNDEAVVAALLTAAQQQADPLWRMPLYAPYLSYLDSPIADLNNAASTRHAGSVTAALFLSRFVPEGTAWTHLDVYSWNDGNRPGRPAGGEAQGLRAFLAMLGARYGVGDT